jgi:colicin import membrane protein
MRIGLVASIIFHLIIAAWVFVGFASAPSRQQVEAIPVELVQAEAPKEAPKKPAELELKLPKPNDQAASQPAKPGPTATQPADTGQTAADKPGSNADKGQPKTDQAEASAGKPPPATPGPPPPPPAPAKDTPADATRPNLPRAVLEAAPAIGGVPHLSPAEVAALVNGKIGHDVGGGVATSSIAGGLSEEQVTAVRAQAQRCWQPPNGWPGGRRAKVTIRFRLKRDGSVDGTPVTIEGPAGQLGKAAADNAALAVKRCGPYQLPAESYDKWQVMELHFVLGG